MIGVSKHMFDNVTYYEKLVETLIKKYCDWAHRELHFDFMSLASDFLHQKKKKVSEAWHDHMQQYIYYNSKLLAPVACFTDPV